MLRLEAVIEVGEEKHTRELSSEAEVINIGRESNNELQIPLTTVSRQHARILLLDNQYFVEDLGSSHGSMLNGAKLAPNDKKLLRDKDVLTLTKARITVTISSDMTKKQSENTQVFAERAVQNILDKLGTEANDDVPFLRIMSGPDEGTKFVLRDAFVECVLGRSRESDMVVNDANASRRHALIKKDRNGVTFQCLGAKNLTQINGKDVPRSTTKRLKNGDEIGIGAVKIVFIDPSAELLDSIEIPGFAPEPDPPSEPVQAEPEAGDEQSVSENPETIGVDGGEDSQAVEPAPGEGDEVSHAADPGADDAGEEPAAGGDEAAGGEAAGEGQVELPEPGADPGELEQPRPGFNPMIIFAIFGAIIFVFLIVVLIALV